MKNKRPEEEIIISVPSNEIRIQHVTCRQGCSLIEPSVKIGGSPSLGVTVAHEGRKGPLYLDPRYGSFENQYSFEFPDGAVVWLYCPHCGCDLSDPQEICTLCSAPMFQLHLPRGGVLEGCLRKGCVGHKMKLVDLDEQFLRLFKDGMLDSYL